MTEDDRNCLLQIQDCISRVREYTQGGKEQFLQSHLIQDATIQNIQLIGEVVKKLSPAFRTARAAVPWDRIARMRDRAAHHYFGLDWKLVWEVVEKHVPELGKQVERILGEEP